MPFGWNVDDWPIVGPARQAVRDAFETVESGIAAVAPVVTDAGRMFFEEFVEIPGLTPEQAWLVFVGTALVGVGTGGTSFAAGMIVRQAARVALRKAVLSGGGAALITAAVGWLAFAGVGGGGEGSGPESGGTASPGSPVEQVSEPIPRTVDIVVQGDGYALSTGELIGGEELFSQWAEIEFGKPGELRVDLFLGADAPEYLVAHARSTLMRVNALRTETDRAVIVYHEE
ncbi:MAG: hypothetical protein K8I27_07005 [Planctomycetes bacterium]|nr:hypothetical protein [Planctomycetota bacterium]